jgi:diguanylate cyclase (GGDEF)-like protein
MVTQTPELTAMPAAESRMLLGKERNDLVNRIFINGARSLALMTGCGALVALIGAIDYYSGTEMAFGIVYMAPVALAAWWGGFAHGILVAMACALSWEYVEHAEGFVSQPIFLVWNGISRFAVFVFTASLLSRLRVSLVLEKKLARSDALTGAANGRTFYEQVAIAIERSLRQQQPLTLAYFDLDNFKQLNDKFGHIAGDQALCDLVRSVNSDIRSTDLFARVGGDEFALLLPETPEEEAKIILDRVQERFKDMMAHKKWPVTISIGAMTFPEPMRDVDALVRRVDDLMYRAKKAGRNRIVHLALRESDRNIELAASKSMERRATARVLCDRPARVRNTAEGDGTDEYAQVRDISASGLCVHLEKKLPEQTILAIEPLHECGAKTLVARVMWVLPESGGWLHECVLPNRLHPDELELWVNEQSAESVSDNL